MREKCKFEYSILREVQYIEQLSFLCNYEDNHFFHSTVTLLDEMRMHIIDSFISIAYNISLL